jgi:hypothetical protein
MAGLGIGEDRWRAESGIVKFYQLTFCSTLNLLSLKVYDITGLNLLFILRLLMLFPSKCLHTTTFMSSISNFSGLGYCTALTTPITLCEHPYSPLCCFPDILRSCLQRQAKLKAIATMTASTGDYPDRKYVPPAAPDLALVSCAAVVDDFDMVVDPA